MDTLKTIAILLAALSVGACSSFAPAAGGDRAQTRAYTLAAQHAALQTCEATIGVEPLEFHLQATRLALSMEKGSAPMVSADFRRGLTDGRHWSSAFRVPCDDASEFLAMDAARLLSGWRMANGFTH
jgi:hypothetical protein